MKQPSSRLNYEDGKIEDSKSSKYLSHDDDELKLIGKKNGKKEEENKSIFS